VFRQMTGVSPCRFLTALRLDAAKRLLSDSEMRIIDICFAVGYNSLGSFTTQFTQLVGLSPGRYRRLHQIDELVEPGELFGTMNFLAADQPEGEIDGWISAADSSSYWIFVGAFPTPVPSGEPVACALLTDPGPFHLARVSDGSYYLRAAAIARTDRPLISPSFDELTAHVGSSHERIVMRGGRVIEGITELKLRPVRPTDPPILVVLPLLLFRHEVSDHRSIA